MLVALLYVVVEVCELTVETSVGGESSVRRWESSGVVDVILTGSITG